MPDGFPIIGSSLLVTLAMFTDVEWRRVPNWLTVPASISGLAYHCYSAGVMQGLGVALAGLITGFGLLCLPYMLGGMGGGDVKLFAAMGCLLGMDAIFQVFLYTAIIGGIISATVLFSRKPAVKSQSPWSVSRWLSLSNNILPTGNNRIVYAYSIPTASGLCVFLLTHGA